MGLMTSKEATESSTTTTPTTNGGGGGGASTPLDDVISLMTPSPSSGLGHWKHQQQNHHVRQASVRNRASQPMPDHTELDMRFAKVLASMDLPPDKAKLLKNYDDEKKWDIICDQEMVHAKDPPAHYLAKLRTYLDPKASRSHRKRKIVGESTSTQVLRDLEISLRTNHIEWVKEFLNDKNQGLDSLVDYLSFRLSMMRHEQRNQEINKIESNERLNATPTTSTSTTTNATATGAALSSGGSSVIGSGDSTFTSAKSNGSSGAGAALLRPGLSELLADSSPNLKRRSRHIAKLNMGASTDDIHVCIMCLRAIMNNKYGFNMVIQHREAINCIALSLIHKSLRTKALVLELLAAICLVKGGHEIILSSFDNFKEVCQEMRRFQTLMEFFINYDLFNIDFMVACMQFVNIVVHSVEDMNYRVHLQYEFTALRLDEYLEKLRLTESEELHVQISAYLDNVFDVAALMEDSETKTAALERVQDLEDDLGRTYDHVAEMERKLEEFHAELDRLQSEREALHQAHRANEEEVQRLRQQVVQNEMELVQRQNMLESKSLELQTLHRSLPKGSSLSAKLAEMAELSNCNNNNNYNNGTGAVGGVAASSSAAPPPPPIPPPPATSLLTATAPPPPPPPTPCPPPPPPPMMMMMVGGESRSAANMSPKSLANATFIPPPPPAGFMQAPDGAMTIKRKVQTKYKLPTLNWIALKPNQVRGTIFNEIDDEKLHRQIDFADFEERFKIGIGGHLTNGGASEVDGGLNTFPSKRFKKPENVSILEHTRLRNIAISRRKLDMPIECVLKAINNLDLKQLSLENVEILQKMVPTEQECKAYKEYVADKKDIALLTEEDKFVLHLTKVERITSKLSIMSYMGNFLDSLHLITPQVYAISKASSSVKQSQKFRDVLEIVLAFGNYLNSSKRGPAYGFKLQSLDTLLDTKSTDKRICLLHYIVATVRQKFPDLLSFDNELFYVDKAAQVSLENVITDVAELERGMDVVRKEADLRGKGQYNHVLKDFLNNSEESLRKMKHESKQAQCLFKECVEYFGESARTADANAFFSLLVRFTKAFKTSDKENEQRRRLEQAAALAASQKDDLILRNNRVNQKKQQEAVINELKNKTSSVREKKLMQQDEVYNGALEDILLGLKSEPYRRADAVRRSQRRRIDNNRLSRTMEEMEM